MRDTLFAHPLEERMANILDREHIPWEYAVSFKICSKGGSKSREVDFVLLHPVYVQSVPESVEAKIYGPSLDRPVKYLEVKTRMLDSDGRVNGDALKQQKELYKRGIRTLIITGSMIEFFEKNGFERKW